MADFWATATDFFSTVLTSPLTTIFLFVCTLFFAARSFSLRYHHKKLLRTLKRGNVFITFFNQHHQRFSYLTKRKNKLAFRDLKFKTFADFLDQFEETEQEGIRVAFASLKKEGRPISLTLTAKRGQRSYRLSAHSFRGNVKWAVVTLHDVTFLEEEKSALRLECRMLTTSLSFYKSAFDHLPWPVWIRREHELLYCNPICAQLLDAEQFDGSSLTASMIDRDFLNATQPKAMIHDGMRCLYHFHEHAFSADIKMGYGEDLTKVYAQEKKLQTHLASYREVLESLSAGVAIYDADQHMRYFNNAYARMFDFDERFLCQNPHLSEVLDDLRARRLLTESPDYNAYKREQVAMLQNLLKPLEQLTHLPDGRSIRVIASPHPMGGSFYIYEDLTDRLNLEAKYNTQLAVYNETLDNLVEGVAVFGSDNRLQFSNKAFEALWRLEPGSMKKGEHLSTLAEHVRHLLSPSKDWDSYKNRVMELVTDRKPKTRKIHRPDNVVVEFAYAPLPDGSNLMSYYDVTDQMKLEKAFEERKIAQQNAVRLKSAFISNISYEMRTPLNAIIGYSELLSQEYAGTLNAKQKLYCTDIVTSSRRLLSLVNNILDLAMIESGHMHLKMAPTSLWDLVAVTIAHYKAQSDFNGQFRESTLPTEAAPILADSQHLQQALETLFIQLSSTLEPSHTLRLQAHQDRGVAHIDLILPNDLSPTYPSLESILNSEPLGISLAKHIIESHGGSLTINTQNPLQRCFSLQFPLTENSQDFQKAS